MSRILTCLDNSIYAHSCADLTAWAATRLGAGVDVVNVLGSSPGVDDLATAGAALDRPQIHRAAEARETETRRALEAQASHMLDDVVARLRAAGVADATARLESGDFLNVLLAQAETADVIVIGKRGETADFVTLRLGSNMERAARACQKPLLVAARAFRPIRKALIAFDGGEHARDAVAAAATSPLLQGLAIELVTVGGATEAAQAALDDAAALLRMRGHAVSARLVDGQPERRIPEIVAREGVDLLVMGAPSHSRLHTLVLGSTTSALLRSCVIPALLLR